MTDYMYFYRTSLPDSKSKKMFQGLLETKRILYNYNHIRKDMTWLLEEIKKCRRCADRYGFRADISRTYNMEGVFYAVKGDLEYAAKCFQRSIQCYDESITDQQKFLFRSNLLAVLPFQHEESTTHLEQQLLWLQRNHALLAKKLLSKKELQAETNFAAVVIILKVTQLQKRSSDFQKIQAWFPLAPITNARYEKSVERVRL